MSRLPGREALVERLEAMIREAEVAPEPVRPGSRRPSPALFVVQVLGHDDLVALAPGGADVVGAEIARRLDRLVRSTDVLGQMGPDRYALLAGAVDPAVAGALTERIRSAFAMPLDVGGSAVSLAVTVAVEFCDTSDGTGPSDAAAALSRAEAQLGPHTD